MSKRKTGLMYSGNFADYKASDGYLCMSAGYNPWIATNDYYDTPERVAEAYDLLKKTGLLDKLTFVPTRLEDKEKLVGFHSREYIDKLDALSNAGGGEVGEYCQIGHKGLNVIREAVGGDKNALDMIMQGKIDNAFCLQRPPSAHAERDKGFGFCVVNDFNILVEYARQKYGLKRIMIIDFDNHYKKGIEDAWYNTDEVLYAEVHQTGAFEENSVADRNADMIGEGRGKGYNVVIPMPSGAGDDAYIKAFTDIIVPVAEQYKPELVVLIAGYASNIFDPLCRQQITADGYKKLVEIVQDIADNHAHGHLIAILEGGKGNYMSFCILKSIEAMSGEETEVIDPVTGLIVGNKLTPDQEKAIEEVKRILSPYWKFQAE
ncbi:MAG: hypothetical protein NC211_08535 [Alistipes senegalensis]|nr:hypothetical protein [Oxalobacter formigenes]MCM1281853.1 hypothetical protein [Alistipes senegalensis]